MQQRWLLVVGSLWVIVGVPLVAQRFLSAKEELQYLQRLARQHPTAMQIDTIGFSASRLPIVAVKISADLADTTPAVLVIGGIHSTDLTSPALCLGLIQLIFQQWDTVAQVFQGRSLYVIPRLSPDPLEGFFESPQRAYQGNRRPVDDDRDGQFDEDGLEDLDGDGIIRWMRVYRPEADWTYHPDDSLLQQRVDRKAGAIGVFHLLPEGRDNDGDLQINEDPQGGVCIDRNFTHRYQPYVPEHGRHPFSESETRALGFFLFTHPEILAVLSFTPYDNIHFPWRLRYPPNPTRPNRFSSDSLCYRQVVPILDSLIPYIGQQTVPPGSLGEWVFYDAGRLSFCVPAWAYPSIDSLATAETIESIELRALRWAQRYDTARFKRWTTIQHPDLPHHRVEIGGFAPFALWNPPADTLFSLPSRWFPVVVKLLRWLPKLELRPLVYRQQGEVYRVDLEITNRGRFPTHTRVGRAVRALRPLQVRLQLDAQQHLLNQPSRFLIPDPILANQTRRVRLWILGRGTVEVTVGSPSAGRQTIRLSLP